MKKFFVALLGLLLLAAPAQAQNNNYLADNGEFLNPFSLANSWSALQTYNANLSVKDTITWLGSVSGTANIKIDPSLQFLQINAQNGFSVCMANANTCWNSTAFSGYNAITLNTINTAAGGLGMFGGATGDSNLYFITPGGGNYQWRANNAINMQLNGGAGLTIGNPGTISGVLGIAGSTSGQFLISLGNTTATALNIGPLVQVNNAGLISNNASLASGLAGLSIIGTTPTPHSSDTADGAAGVFGQVTANSATNELIYRAMFITGNNALTGGGHLQIMRVLDITAQSQASTTTDEYDGLFFESSSSGSVGTGSAIRIAAWPGTTKNTINDTSGGNWVNVGQLSLGAGTIGSGTINLNGITSGTGVIFVNNVGNIGLQGVGGSTFIVTQGGTSGSLNIQGSTSGTGVISTTATGNLTLQGVAGNVVIFPQGGTSANLALNGATSGGGTIAVSGTGGHLAIFSSSNPTLTAGCNGAGSSVSGSDQSGTVTGQTAAATSCTLTFGTAYGAAPNCVAMGISSPLTGVATPATGTLVVNFASTANYKFSYWCPGN